jgi:hypothetical protein
MPKAKTKSAKGITAKKTAAPKKAKTTAAKAKKPTAKKKITPTTKNAIKKASTRRPRKKAVIAIPDEQLLFFFGGGKAEGNGEMKDILGGKGAGLAQMTNAGLNVPPGFTLSTKVCSVFYENNLELPQEIKARIAEYIHRLEKLTGQKFGDSENPLLVSVRSGAKFSMPGMMDTVLNLGLNDQTINGLISRTGNERFAYDLSAAPVTNVSHIFLIAVSSRCSAVSYWVSTRNFLIILSQK